MTITLQEEIGPNQAMILVDNPDETSLDDVLQIDDEFVVVRGRPSADHLLVGRGALGSPRAAHLVGATVGQAVLGSGEQVVITRTSGVGDSFAVVDQSGQTVLRVGAGGEMVIAPNADNSNSLVSLAIHSQDHNNAFPLELYDKNGVLQWYIDADGVLDMVQGGGAIIPDQGNIVLVNHSGVGVEIVRPALVVDPNALLLVRFGSQVVFRVDDDGSVHIKTGTSIVADL